MRKKLCVILATLASIVYTICILAAATYAVHGQNYPLACVLFGYGLNKLGKIVGGAVSDSIKRKELLIVLRKTASPVMTQEQWNLLNELIMENHH